MTFQPVVPIGGLAGWRYVSDTLDRQIDAFSRSPINQRDTEYFSENITSVSTAEELVNDRRLLRVALGAFGLQDDINSKAFVQQVLEGGTEERTALANRLADTRYTDLASAFGFGNLSGVRTQDAGFAAEIVTKFQAAQFEVAVGDQDEDMRLALNANRELDTIADRSSSEDTKWYLILGTPPLRAVFERALALPSSFGQIDLEKQVETMKDMMSRRMGIDSLSEFSEPGKREQLVETFMLQSQIAQINQTTSPQSIALTLLSSISAR